MNMQKENSPTDQTKNKRYVFVQREEDDYTSIKLTKGTFNGVIYKYGRVQFADKENEDGLLPMKFDYDILENPYKVELDNKEFLDYIGDILIELMDEKVKSGGNIIGKN